MLHSFRHTHSGKRRKPATSGTAWQTHSCLATQVACSATQCHSVQLTPWRKYLPRHLKHPPPLPPWEQTRIAALLAVSNLPLSADAWLGQTSSLRSVRSGKCIRCGRAVSSESIRYAACSVPQRLSCTLTETTCKQIAHGVVSKRVRNIDVRS